ncbi:ImmA/IrrE family metallo-endopeptidase [Rhizobium leguminosarum]|uniref:ImmA/IrrE family metallo-endopeptidase n=1 Tax=Rhizobium ruizarguesonis TaxID=2081791 RepID=UPI0013BE02A8|nr:ImmA/IrrE family metallo-endopeptidase [Rhizobium ruizarguesonis]NEJ06824.1 ImmA/IrrE family metallo-endopeptidase [Rhizobium ruizarguesonis]
MSALEPTIGSFEKRDINDLLARLIRDLGNPEPPLRLEDVRALQKLDLTYYSKTDLNLLDEMAHRARMGGNFLMTSAKRMVEVVEKYRLRGLLMVNDDQRKIFIDNDVVQLKRRFIISHEILHDLLPWHRSLLLGDNESTLSPSCHQDMEAEANYGARRLLFMGDRFAREAKDLDLSWNSVKLMKERYGNTLTTAVWHMVCERFPDHPVFGLISRHPLHHDIGGGDDGRDVTHMMRSNGFQMRFGSFTESDAFNAVRTYISGKKRGPLGDGICYINDANGESCAFEVTSFSNGYDVLTLGSFVNMKPLIFPVG